MITSVILLVVYVLGLVFTLRTHAHIFSRPPQPETMHAEPMPHAGWSVKKSVMFLLLASVGIGFVAELLVKSSEELPKTFGWNEIFVGVILLAIIGNAAEHSTALLLARRNDMDTAMTISFQSSIQIALFATPFLVLLSILMLRLNLIWPEHGSPQPLDLIFSPMEVVAVLLTVLIVVVVCLNGQSNWFEGVLLLAVYCILGITFFYIPEATGGGYDVHPAAATTGPAAP